jgi:hypothetical protein
MVKLSVSSALTCTGSNVNTCRLKHFHFPGMGASSGPPGVNASSMIGRMSCLYSRTPFLMDSPLLLSTPSLCAAFFLTCGCLVGRFEYPTIRVGKYDFDQIRGKLKTFSLQRRPCWPLLAKSRTLFIRGGLTVAQFCVWV